MRESVQVPPTTWHFPRLKGNHRSIMVRRNIVPQPLVMLSGFVRRKSVRLVNG
jgi:hypothetical protein